MKVLMICDLEDWILGKIARRLQQLLSPKIYVTVLVSHSSDFKSQFFSLQKEHDVVHFLSPWDFFNIANHIHKPCAVTLWHMVDWSDFKKNSRRIDALCVGSEQWMKISKNHIPEKLPLTRIHYGLDTNNFQKRASARQDFIKEYALNENTIVLGFAGSAWSNEGNRKGLDRIWRCLINLKKETNIKFILRIAGRHWTVDAIPIELRDFVRLTLDLPTESLPNFYSSLDYYICASAFEGVPYPVLEAMSCECVVLSTPVGVVPEIFVNGKNGFLLDDQDNLEKDFVNIISKTAKDLQYRVAIGSLARQTIIKNFSWELSVNSVDYMEIYNQAIKFYKKRSIFWFVSYNLNRVFVSVFSSTKYYLISLRSRIRIRKRLSLFFKQNA